jgi:hypothetical protein
MEQSNKKIDAVEVHTVKIIEHIKEIAVPVFKNVDVQILDKDKIVRQLEAVVVDLLEKTISSVNLELLLSELINKAIFNATKTLEIKDVKLVPTEVEQPVFNKVDVTQMIMDQVKAYFNK